MAFSQYPEEERMPSSHLILCCPLFLLSSIPPSIRVSSTESTLRMRWPKYWSFSFNISPSNENPRLISLRMDWLDLLAVQGTLKSLLQHHSSKVSSWTIVHQVPLSMEYSRQEYWSGWPFPSPGDLPNPEIEPRSPHCRQILYYLSHKGPSSTPGVH